MIGKETVQNIKTNIDLKTYIESRGIEFKKNGKGHFALCPFHDDTNPSLSINPKNNLFKCFGCGTSGDIIRFVELYDQVDFKEAVNILSQKPVSLIPSLTRQAGKQNAKDTHMLSIKEKKLLGRVMTYYQHTLTQDKRGMNYLTNDRGINNTQSIKDFGTGYANGTLLEILPQDEEVINSLKKIGILNNKGNEIFYNSVVFPLVNAGKSPVSLYGRNIDESIDMDHLYLSGPRTGLSFNAYSVVKQSQTAILTESIIDGLTLYDQGFKNVIPIYGVNGLIDDHIKLMSGKIKQAYIVFDADVAGKKGAEALASRLKEKGITPHIVDLPSKDVNLFFSRHTPEEFEALLKQANPDSLEESQSVSSRKQTMYKQHEYGFTVGYADRQYQIKGIQRTSTQLKATVKVSKDVDSNLPFELSTIDFYSSRSRVWFAKLCSNLFEASEELIREDLGRLMALIEDYKPQEKKTAAKEPSQAEKERAMTFLKNKDMFKEILCDIKTLGVVGEETNIIVCHLAATSRKLPKPISIAIISRSGAGKSTLQKIVLKLIPDEDKKEYTRISDQALFYKDEDALVHKVVAIEEEAGIGGAAYALRNIQSAGEITLAVVTKDTNGKMHTEDYKVKGPVAVMMTTTSTEIDQETASRSIILSIDESEQMTKAILKKQREQHSLEGLANQIETEAIINKHHTAQRLLRPIAVINPFTEYLSYPAKSLNARRDNEKYMGLIQTIAYLRQYQKKVKILNPAGSGTSGGKEYVEVDLYDIELANQLANEVLGHSLDELSRPSRTLLKAIYKMACEIVKKQKIPIEEVEFSRRQIRENINWADWQIKAHIRQLEELEYLYVKIGSRGKRYSYALNYTGQGEDGDKFFLQLTPVEEIRKLMGLRKTMPSQVGLGQTTPSQVKKKNK